MDQRMLEIVAERFRALGDPSRLAIVSLLREGEYSVGDLAEQLKLRHGTVSAQLRVLETAGLVAKRKQGTKVFYRLEGGCVEKVCSLICSDVAHSLIEQASLFQSFADETKSTKD